MVIEGPGSYWVVGLDCRVYLTSVWAVLMVLGGLGSCWVVMLVHMVYLTSVNRCL